MLNTRRAHNLLPEVHPVPFTEACELSSSPPCSRWVDATSKKYPYTYYYADRLHRYEMSNRTTSTLPAAHMHARTEGRWSEWCQAAGHALSSPRPGMVGAEASAATRHRGGKRVSSSMAVASPTIPAPMIAMSYLFCSGMPGLLPSHLAFTICYPGYRELCSTSHVPSTFGGEGNTPVSAKLFFKP